jgi:hypothetical protein
VELICQGAANRLARRPIVERRTGAEIEPGHYEDDRDENCSADEGVSHSHTLRRVFRSRQSGFPSRVTWPQADGTVATLCGWSLLVLPCDKRA